MTHIKSREINIINCIILVLVLLVSFLPNILPHSHITSVDISPLDFTNGQTDLNYRMRFANEQVVETYEAIVLEEDLKLLPRGDLGLTITRLAGQGYKVWWNDEYIGQAGDPNNGQANIWNATNLFLIDDRLIEQTNKLAILTYAIYEVGTYENTILISTWENAVQIKAHHNMFADGLTLVSIGMTIFAVVIILMLSIFNPKNKIKIAALTMALVFIAIHALNYLQLDYMDMPYLRFKKIMMTCSYMSLFLLGNVIAASIRRYTPLIVGALTFCLFIFGELLIKDPIQFKLFCNYMAILIPVNLISWLFMLAPSIKKSDEARILFGMIVTITGVRIWDSISLIFIPSGIAQSPFSLVMTMSALLVMFMALNSILRNKQLKEQIEQKDMLYQQTITDSLSGLYNKSYCAALIDKLEPPFAITMIDIDQFKDINDNYGHLLGDEGIRSVANTIKSILRQDDVVGRYGGDEFMAAITCSPEKAYEICERVRTLIAKTAITLEEQSARITVSIGIYNVTETMRVDEMLTYADRALYRAKRTGRNCIKVHGSKK